MINKVILVGNLGNDPETRESNNGTTIGNLRVATSHSVKRDDKWENETEWHVVKCFGKTAEFAGQYLQKGGKVYVEGRIHTRSWEDKDGNKRYTTEVIADTLKSLDRRERDAQDQGDERQSKPSQSGSGRSGKPSQRQAPGSGGGYDEDIPF